MVLERAQHNFVAPGHIGVAPRVRHEINSFGRAPRPHDFVSRKRIDELGHDVARALVRVGRPLCEVVRAAVDVRVVLLVVFGCGVEDALRLLGRGAAVEVDEVVAAALLFERGELLSQYVGVDGV